MDGTAQIDLGEMSLPELIEAAREILDEIMLRMMQEAGEHSKTGMEA